MSGNIFKLINDMYQLTVIIADREIHIHLKDLAMDFDFADSTYIYRASRSGDEGSIISKWLNNPTIKVNDEIIEITGILAGLRVEHSLRLPTGRAMMEEQIILHNPTENIIALEHFAAGMQRRIADEVGSIFPELSSDRLVAIPFRHRPTDSASFDIDFLVADLIKMPGREHRANKWATLPQYGYLPSMQWASEGWAWIHGEHTLGIFKFNQEAMEFSVLSPQPDDEGLALRFGGACLVAGDPSSLNKILPGQTIELGITRYETVRGDYNQAYYAFRTFLDENNCRFPKGYNPPVHWNELYDNPEWHLSTPGNPAIPRMTRPVTYSKDLLELEAQKACDYSCEALYLDPGWDTDFGTLRWGEDWLGPCKEFIQKIHEQYGLRVSLHCPLAPWVSHDGRGVSSWPSESFQMDADGNIAKGRICLGSKQYLDEAAKRILANCADGVTFLMFDGNWWNGDCWNPNHGHPVPYTMEDHIRANLELARRVHEKYPNVLIEMHDMIAGGTTARYTPVYYKYGLPGSYDENWGFELMWQPMEDIRSGRARSLYYYNLGCNVPIYLHIDLRDDNEHCLVLWWYASTCRHLGIGGTHSNPAIAQAQKSAMKKYRQLERFYKEGEFYGINEEAHVHALADENAFVINLFNLSDESRLIRGSITFEEMGIDRDKWYINPKGGQFNSNFGTFSINRRMPPWSAEAIEVRPIACI